MRFDLIEISGAFQENRVPSEIAFPISLNVLGTVSKTMTEIVGSRQQAHFFNNVSLTLIVCLSLVTASGAL